MKCTSLLLSALFLVGCELESDSPDETGETGWEGIPEAIEEEVDPVPQASAEQEVDGGTTPSEVDTPAVPEEEVEPSDEEDPSSEASDTSEDEEEEGETTETGDGDGGEQTEEETEDETEDDGQQTAWLCYNDCAHLEQWEGEEALCDGITGCEHTKCAFAARANLHYGMSRCAQVCEYKAVDWIEEKCIATCNNNVARSACTSGDGLKNYQLCMGEC